MTLVNAIGLTNAIENLIMSISPSCQPPCEALPLLPAKRIERTVLAE
jgi:hypothetical protein